MDADGDKLHIVVFPWLAFGHMIPFLELSKSLARRGHLISFISTPKNIHRLLLPNLHPEINFIPFSLPRVEGMAESVEATTDLPPEDLPYLKKALNGLEHPFRSFIQEASPKPVDWIIQDFIQHWVPPIAAESGASLIFFATSSAASLSFMGHPSRWLTRELDSWLVSPPWVPFPSKVAYRLHEILSMADGRQQKSTLLPGDDVPDTDPTGVVVNGCDALAIRSCVELEPDHLPLLEKIYKMPVFPVGLLLPPPQQAGDGNFDITMDWLRTQNQKSVLYIALGSEVAVRTELVHELALGLELAGLPFLWALRRPPPFGGGSSAEILLPEGFEERTRGYGRVAMGWVPQTRVLADESVGGFLTHCGWGSVVESLHFGHPLVMLPVFGDQYLNARMLEEKGIGVEVEKREEDGSFTRDDVAKAVRLVMVEEEGGPYRKKAREIMKKTVVSVDKKCQEKYVDEFVRYLIDHRPSVVTEVEFDHK